LLAEAHKPDPVYQGKKTSIRGSEVEGIVAALKAKGITGKWHQQSSAH
jgi:hypothetical protein